DLFVHVVQRTRGSERQANDRNHQQLATLETPHHPGNASAKRSRLIHYAERAADQKNEKDYGRRGGHSPRNRYYRLKWSDRRLWNCVVGSGDYDYASGRGIGAPVELSGGKHVSHRGGQHDESHQQRQWVRKAEYQGADGGQGETGSRTKGIDDRGLIEGRGLAASIIADLSRIEN